ncbi:MAG: DUF799 family lipoprotein [Elusimicrobia bacterium]|nr:DUF799 family lipoprotein [Elusimicrobiota bacterium]
MPRFQSKFMFWIIPLLAVLSGCGIPKIKGTLLSSKPGAQMPDLIAILPPDNHSNDLSAVEVVQRSGGMMLTTRGYFALSNKAQDAALQKMGITDGGQLKSYRAENICKSLGMQGLLYSTVENFNEVNIGFWISKKVQMKMKLTDDKGESLWEGDALYSIRQLTLDPSEAAKAFVERKAGELVEKALRVHLVPETDIAALELGKKITPWPNPQDAQRR